MQYFEVDNLNLGAGTNVIQVPALEYIQGNRRWYGITLSLKTLGKFINTTGIKPKNKEIIGAEIKNRFLDRKHKNDIKDYIKIENEFTIPAITLVSPEHLDFRPFTFHGIAPSLDASGSRAGIIMLPIDYEFECLDGNHRTVAIKELASEAYELIVGSSILLNIVIENRARKIRQDFVDVNKNAKSTTSSINTLFNTREPLSSLVNDIVVDTKYSELEYLKQTTELLATSVSKRSKKIYTINNIKNAIVEIGGLNSQSNGTEKMSEKLIESEYKQIIEKRTKIFFENLKENTFVKQCLLNEANIPEIREKCIITSGTGMIVISRVAGFIFKHFEDGQIYSQITRLIHLDWSRNSKIFVGNIVLEDKILNSRDAINKAVDSIKFHLGYSESY